MKQKENECVKNMRNLDASTFCSGSSNVDDKKGEVSVIQTDHPHHLKAKKSLLLSSVKVKAEDDFMSPSSLSSIGVTPKYVAEEDCNQKCQTPIMSKNKTHDPFESLAVEDEHESDDSMCRKDEHGVWKRYSSKDECEMSRSDEKSMRRWNVGFSF